MHLTCSVSDKVLRADLLRHWLRPDKIFKVYRKRTTAQAHMVQCTAIIQLSYRTHTNAFESDCESLQEEVVHQDAVVHFNVFASSTKLKSAYM